MKWNHAQFGQKNRALFLGPGCSYAKSTSRPRLCIHKNQSVIALFNEIQASDSPVLWWKSPVILMYIFGERRSRTKQWIGGFPALILIGRKSWYWYLPFWYSLVYTVWSFTIQFSAQVISSLTAQCPHPAGRSTEQSSAQCVAGCAQDAFADRWAKGVELQGGYQYTYEVMKKM